MMTGSALVPAVDSAQHIPTSKTYNTTDHRCFQEVSLGTLLFMHYLDMDCGEYLEHKNLNLMATSVLLPEYCSFLDVLSIL